MKLLVIASIIALSFTTGFTCSKNTPEAAKTEAPAAGEQPAAQPSQEQMAQPAAGAEGAAAAQPAAGEQPAAQPEHK